jgi:spore coat polysaccharide biosynthesis protein SpsF (cytidylyltransferase family)
LPQKVFQKIGDKTLLQWVYDAGVEAERMLRAKNITAEAMILGPEKDMELERFCDENLLKSWFPAFVREDDLILRYLKTARERNFTHIVRVTSDCWQMNPEIIVRVVELMLNEKADYVSNTTTRSFIEGLDCQACSVKALAWFDREQTKRREHPFIDFDRNESVRTDFEYAGFKYLELLNSSAEWMIRTSIDDEADLKRARELYAKASGSGLVK